VGPYHCAVEGVNAMTDDLVKRIDARARQGIAATPFNLLMDAKERIEALTAERDGLLRCVTDNHVALCRAEAAEAERDRLREAAIALRDDMTERAEFRMDTISGEQYRIVNAGNSAWMGFCAALKGESHE